MSENDEDQNFIKAVENDIEKNKNIMKLNSILQILDLEKISVTKDLRTKFAQQKKITEIREAVEKEIKKIFSHSQLDNANSDLSGLMLEIKEKLDNKPSNSRMTEQTVQIVKKFYYESDISRQLLGIKDYVSVKQVDGTRKLITKRLILGNLNEIYASFKNEFRNLKIDFSTLLNAS